MEKNCALLNNSFRGIHFSYKVDVNSEENRHCRKFGSRLARISLCIPRDFSTFLKEYGLFLNKRIFTDFLLFSKREVILPKVYGIFWECNDARRTQERDEI